MIRRLIKYLIILAIMGAALVAGYAMFFDLPAEQTETIIPVTPLGQ